MGVESVDTNAAAERRTCVSYLLGRLPEAESQDLEERYFRDSELFERLTALETDLLDEYVRGDLPAEDREAFERRLEQSSLLRSRLESAVAIQKTFGPRSETAASPRVRAPGARTGLAWLARESEAVRRALGDENAALRRDLASRSAPVSPPSIAAAPSEIAGRILSFRLAPGLLRDLGSSNDVIVPKGVAAVLLEVPVGRGAGGTYRLRVESVAGDVLLEQSNVPASARSGGASVVLALPTASIPAGDYLLRVSRLSTDAGRSPEPVADLAFRLAYR
jgi:anti-sigma factor RsiW